MERTLGHGPEELIGSSHFEHVHPEDRDHVAAPFERLVATPLVPCRWRIAFFADGLQWSLEQEGIEVRIVATGAEAPPAVAEFRPDVVVLDLNLPDARGRDVYRRIAAASPVAVVFSSGYALESEIEPLPTVNSVCHTGKVVRARLAHLVGLDHVGTAPWRSCWSVVHRPAEATGSAMPLSASPSRCRPPVRCR